MTRFFEDLYKEEAKLEIELPFGVFKQFSHLTKESLECVPSPEEVKEVVWSCDPNKSPSYDGFNIKFIKEMWDVIGTDIVDFVLNFFYLG